MSGAGFPLLAHKTREKWGTRRGFFLAQAAILVCGLDGFHAPGFGVPVVHDGCLTEIGNRNGEHVIARVSLEYFVWNMGEFSAERRRFGSEDAHRRMRCEVESAVACVWMNEPG